VLNLAITIERRSHYAEAERLLREAVTLLDAAFAGGDPLTAAVEMNLGRLLHQRSRHADALPHVERAVAMTSPIVSVIGWRSPSA
jgi:hypothetical protein